MTERGPSRFVEAYDETPPWDVGRPQRAIVQAAERGWVKGSVLEVGCGTGENALYLADRGHEVLGVDVVEDAVELSRAEARERGVEADFAVMDALDVGSLARRFDTVVDVGLFHVFDDEQRADYVDALREATGSGGRVVLLCFSDREPGDWGPRRVSEDELRAAFADWTVNELEPSAFETNREEGSAAAWCCLFTR